MNQVFEASLPIEERTSNEERLQQVQPPFGIDDRRESETKTAESERTDLVRQLSEKDAQNLGLCTKLDGLQKLLDENTQQMQECIKEKQSVRDSQVVECAHCIPLHTNIDMIYVGDRVPF